MALRFPNARLHMHNLLADDSISGSGAIAMAALEYGLVEADFANRLTEPDKKSDCCLSAARSVLNHYFESRDDSTLQEVDVEMVWSSLLKEANRYLVQNGISDGGHQDIDCLNTQSDSAQKGNGRSNRKDGANSNGNGHASAMGFKGRTITASNANECLCSKHSCSKFAPVVFDLLLQEIRRYH